MSRKHLWKKYDELKQDLDLQASLYAAYQTEFNLVKKFTLEVNSLYKKYTSYMDIFRAKWGNNNIVVDGFTCELSSATLLTMAASHIRGNIHAKVFGVWNRWEKNTEPEKSGCYHYKRVDKGYYVKVESLQDQFNLFKKLLTEIGLSDATTQRAETGPNGDMAQV